MAVYPMCIQQRYPVEGFFEIQQERYLSSLAGQDEILGQPVYVFAKERRLNRK
jgi:hypothetical protein